MLERLKNSLLLLVIAGQIQCYAQKGLDTICLSGKEFDFFAESYVRFKGLQVDTAINSQEIKRLELIIKEQNQQEDMDSLTISNRQTALNDCVKKHDELAKKHDAQVAKNGRLKKVLTGALAADGALIIVLVLIFVL